MLIYGIIFPRWRVAADVSLGSWKIFRRFFPSLFRPIIASAGRKCYTAPAIIPLLFLSPSLISFKSSFGHSPLFPFLLPIAEYGIMIVFILKVPGKACGQSAHGGNQ